MTIRRETVAVCGLSGLSWTMGVSVSVSTTAQSSLSSASRASASASAIIATIAAINRSITALTAIPTTTAAAAGLHARGKGLSVPLSVSRLKSVVALPVFP